MLRSLLSKVDTHNIAREVENNGLGTALIFVEVRR